MRESSEQLGTPGGRAGGGLRSGKANDLLANRLRSPPLSHSLSRARSLSREMTLTSCQCPLIKSNSIWRLRLIRGAGVAASQGRTGHHHAQREEGALCLLSERVAPQPHYFIFERFYGPGHATYYLWFYHGIVSSMRKLNSYMLANACTQCLCAICK